MGEEPGLVEASRASMPGMAVFAYKRLATPQRRLM